GFMTAEAQHFSVYAAAQSQLDLELSLSEAAASSDCEGKLVARARLGSPLAEVGLSSVNNMSSALQARIAGDAPSVQDLLTLADLTGSLRSVQVFELVEHTGGGEVLREQLLAITTLHLAGDGTADITHTDALGNVIAEKHYQEPLLALAEIEQRL